MFTAQGPTPLKFEDAMNNPAILCEQVIFIGSNGRNYGGVISLIYTNKPNEFIKMTTFSDSLIFRWAGRNGQWYIDAGLHGFVYLKSQMPYTHGQMRPC